MTINVSFFETLCFFCIALTTAFYGHQVWPPRFDPLAHPTASTDLSRLKDLNWNWEPGFETQNFWTTIGFPPCWSSTSRKLGDLKFLAFFFNGRKLGTWGCMVKLESNPEVVELGWLLDCVLDPCWSLIPIPFILDHLSCPPTSTAGVWF